MNNILLLSEIFPPMNGGSGRWFWEVYTRIHNNNVIVAAGEHHYAAQFDAASNISILRLNLKSSEWGIKSLKGFRYYWHIYLSLRKIIKHNNIKMIHCGRSLPEGFIAYLIKITMHIPYICYIHGEDLETAMTSRELTFMVRRSLKHASLLIANSKNTAKIIHKAWKIDPSKVKVIHPGVDTQKFFPAPRNEKIRHELGWSNRKVILTVGRLQKRKGHDVMLKAIPTIKKTIPDILYTIIGQGEELSSLQHLAQELSIDDNVQFLSNVADERMIHCYQQCDIFILPNRTIANDIEGFGMVLLEAQACARPVIAGDSGGTRETMIPGETGFIVDCTSHDKIANAVLKVITNPELASSMGIKGRKHIEENFDWSSLAQQVKSAVNLDAV